MRKMSIIRLDNRGQISAEYLLLFVVILTVLFFMINNFVGPTIDSSNTVSRASDTKIVVESIADAVNVVYANGPGAKRTVDVNVPQDITLDFNKTSQTVGTTLYLDYNGNSSNPKIIDTTLNVGEDISPTTLALSKGWRTVQVYWNITSDDIEVKVTK